MLIFVATFGSLAFALPTIAAAIQLVTATSAALTAIMGLIIAVRNLPRFTSWFKSQDQLISERDGAIAREKNALAMSSLAHQAAQDVKMSVDALRDSLEENKARLEKLEGVIAAVIGWIPKILEYVVWLETIVKRHEPDLGGREMPPLPKILIDYLKRLGITS